MRAILRVVIVAIAGLVSQVACAQNLLQVFSEPDWRPGTRSSTFDSSNATFTAGWMNATNAVRIDVRSGQEFHLLTFAAANNGVPVVGTYTGAMRSGTAGAPVIGVIGTCSDNGSFSVLEISVDANRNIVRFAADFEARCEGSEPAHYGGIRFNSAIPYVPSPPVRRGLSFLEIASTAGEPVGRGQHFVFTRDDGYFLSVLQDSRAGIVFRGLSSSTNWGVRFQPPPGQTLAVGTYANAGSLHNGVHPGLGISGEGRAGCTEAGSWFTVHELRYDYYDVLTSFAADFVQYCNGSPMHGAVRFNSPVPYTPPALPPAPARVITIDGPNFLWPSGRAKSGQRVQVLDANGQAMPGVQVQFSSDSCGVIAGWPSAYVTTDAHGIAASPAFTPYWDCLEHADVAFLLPKVGTSFAFRTYTHSAVTMTPLPSPSISVGAGQSFRVGVNARAFGLPVVGRPVFFGVDIHLRDDIAPSPRGTTTVTDSEGNAYMTFVAGAAPGGYPIQVILDDALTTISVTQAIPRHEGVGGMWWSPHEAGWGMSLVQHGERLFGVIYAYDAAGKPVWYVMPTGSWSPGRNRYSGDLFSPRGSPFFQYDSARFAPGPAVGNIAITFDSAMNPGSAVLEYVINGVAGQRLVTPMRFGSEGSASGADHSDMWWGGANQNGWGVAILQQGDTIFNVWFTYDAADAPTWFVMPGGHWTSASTYEGSIYRTLGSPWLGHGYDASQLKVFDTGPYRLRFDGDNATLDYSVDGRAGSLRLDKLPF